MFPVFGKFAALHATALRCDLANVAIIEMEEVETAAMKPRIQDFYRLRCEPSRDGGG